MNIYSGKQGQDPYAEVPPVTAFPGNTPGTGNNTVPRYSPPVSVTGNAPRYADVAALLDGTMPEPPAPDVLARTDGHALFYAGQVNWVFGDPECGKTWLCAAAAVEQLHLGNRVLWVDLDHNGVTAVVTRLLTLDAPVEMLRDIDRFRFAEPEDKATLLAVVADAKEWCPEVTIVDSIGELLPLFGVSSNSPDDFTTVHAHVLKPLALTGSAVLAVDHLAKNTDSRTSGPGGTAAKRRAIGGTSIRVTVKDAFTPGSGGAAHLAVNKDRHGGLRAQCPTGDREPYAGTFVLKAIDDGIEWSVVSPENGQRNPEENAPTSDVEAVANLNPAPVSVRDARGRLGWSNARTAAALKTWRRALPVTDTGGGKRSNTTPPPTWRVSGEPVVAA